MDNTFNRPIKQLPAWRAITKQDFEATIPVAPLPMCFTRSALDNLLTTVGMARPETGALGFCPEGFLGFSYIVFDESGSKRGLGAVYDPDLKWGERQAERYLAQPPGLRQVISGFLHSHHGDGGRPSWKIGFGMGDLGFAEAMFVKSPTLRALLIPICTGMTSGTVAIWPWIVMRDNPAQPLLAQLHICEVNDFPERDQL